MTKKIMTGKSTVKADPSSSHSLTLERQLGSGELAWDPPNAICMWVPVM